MDQEKCGVHSFNWIYAVIKNIETQIVSTGCKNDAILS